MKLQITLDDDLVKRIDDYVRRNYMTRSTFLSLASSQFLNAFDASFAMVEMSRAMTKIADSGMIDDETKKKLDDFNRLAVVIGGSGKVKLV